MFVEYFSIMTVNNEEAAIPEKPTNNIVFLLKFATNPAYNIIMKLINKIYKEYGS